MAAKPPFRCLRQHNIAAYGGKKHGVPSFSDGTPCASFYILQGSIPFFAGTHLDNIFYIIYKDLAIADMTGV